MPLHFLNTFLQLLTVVTLMLIEGFFCRLLGYKYVKLLSLEEKWRRAGGNQLKVGMKYNGT